MIQQNDLPIAHRFYIYQKERFPFLGHGLLILAFTFSAVSYSHICRHKTGFIPMEHFIPGYLLTFSLFFLLRVFDEFKDKEDDALYRKYLPVPRGLISLKELMYIASFVIAAQLLLILLFHPQMLIFYAIVMGYLFLMRVEFFVPDWLKKHQVAYVISHMLIIPLIDIYGSALDWYLVKDQPPTGLFYFFGVSFMNGVVLEIGRKLRAPENEETGVISYTSLYGHTKAVLIWLSTLILTYIFAMSAGSHAAYGILFFSVLTVIFIICSIPAFLFLKNPTKKSSKLIEYSSALWTILMYLCLGGIPMISTLL